MPDEETLLTPAMTAQIGREGEPISVEISREATRRMAEALGEDDPAVIAALEGDDPRAVVPPYALLTVVTRMRQVSAPDLPGHGLLAADEWRYDAPVRLGDRLRVVPKIADIQERIGGRVGHSLFVHYEWSCTNQDGDTVARVHRTVAYYPKRGDAR